MTEGRYLTAHSTSLWLFIAGLITWLWLTAPDFDSFARVTTVFTKVDNRHVMVRSDMKVLRDFTGGFVVSVRVADSNQHVWVPKVYKDIPYRVGMPHKEWRTMAWWAGLDVDPEFAPGHYTMETCWTVVTGMFRAAHKCIQTEFEVS